MTKIVISTFGSSGDLHPYLAIGLELKNRNYDVIIATSDAYKDKVEKTGLKFHLIRPTISLTDTKLAKRAMDLEKGPEVIIKELIYPYIEQSYEDLLSISASADLLINHSISFAGPIVAEKLGIPWVSCVLSPNAHWSYLDPSVISGSPFLANLPNRGKFINKIFINLTKRIVKNWSKPLYQFREKINLPKGKDPIFYQLHSPFLSLSLFSPVLANKQSDWPANNVVTGFCFFNEHEVNNNVNQFLHEGEPPIVFTLGSAAVVAAGNFYDLSLEVLGNIKKRAILLVGQNQITEIPQSIKKDILITSYLPYNQIFPKSLIVVNQGGIGTVAQVMKAGKPMLGIPFSHDQPDNTARIKRAGMGEVIFKQNLTKARLQNGILSILNNQQYFDNAEQIGKEINLENGVQKACDTIEKNFF